MGTPKGFPIPPALWLRRAKPVSAYAMMGTLKGFPIPPALWLRRAKPVSAYAMMGTLKGFPFQGVRAANSETLFPTVRHRPDGSEVGSEG